MARRYKDDGDSIWGLVSGVGGLYLLWVIFLYFTNRVEYWRQIWYFAAFLAVVLAAIYFWKVFKNRRQEKKLNNMLSSLKQNGLEEYVKNFIARFGVQKGKKEDWTYRGHYFDWERLRDFRKVLNERGMKFSYDNWGDVSTLLRYFIQQDEERLTRESISLLPRKFMDLSGGDFENLLCRLFTAMGYAVQRTGKVGDQGGDLIANLSGQRIVIQAKRYSNSVGNAAVQEAIAAQKFYDCNRAMVATNSSFTREALELAKVSNVELIGGNKLSELILQNLKESWG